MKSKKITKNALMLMILGLLLTAAVPLISRHLGITDGVRGFLTGLGLALEVMAIVKMSGKKSCALPLNK